MVDRCFSNMLCKGRSRSGTVFPLLIYSPNVCSSKAVKYATYSVLKKWKNSSPVYYYKNTHPSSNETGNEKFILQSSLLIGSPPPPQSSPSILVTWAFRWQGRRPGTRGGGWWCQQGVLGSGAARGTSLLQLYLAEALLAAAQDSCDAAVSKWTVKWSSGEYQWGCINRGPEDVFQKVSACHVILTRLPCGLGSLGSGLSNVMTKDGKAVKKPILVMT